MATGDELSEAVAPVFRVLREVAKASDELHVQMGGKPSAAVPCPALDEIVAGEAYVSESWPDPVGPAHSIAGLLLLYGRDALTSYCALFDGDDTPIWSHLAVARAALEALGCALWLSEPGLDIERRVARGQAAVLHAANEEHKFHATKAASVTHRERVEAGARRHGWRVTSWNTRATVRGETWPTGAAAMRKLFTNPDGAPSAGDALWWYLSGVTHSGLHAIMAARLTGSEYTRPSADHVRCPSPSARPPSAWVSTPSHSSERSSGPARPGIRSSDGRRNDGRRRWSSAAGASLRTSR